MSTRENIRAMCDDFIKHRIPLDTFTLLLVKEILSIRDNATAIKIAQSLFFGIVPEGGDGE